jgi:hypothetical protein
VFCEKRLLWPALLDVAIIEMSEYLRQAMAVFINLNDVRLAELSEHLHNCNETAHDFADIMYSQ